MKLLENRDKKNFECEMYRTDDALFIDFPSLARRTFVRMLRICATLSWVLLPVLLLCLFPMLGRMMQGDFEVLFVILFPLALFGVLGALCIAISPRVLLRIDKDAIFVTRCFFGLNSSSYVFARPERIEFVRSDGQWAIADNTGKTVATIRSIGGEELVWVQEEIARFEQECPRQISNDVPTRSGKLREERREMLQALKTRHFRGQLLREIPNPEQRFAKTKPHSLAPGTLQIRCPWCNAILSSDHVIKENSLSICPSCGKSYEISELQISGEPKRKRLLWDENDQRLIVVQKPVVFGVAFYCTLFVLWFDYVFTEIILHVIASNPGASLVELGLMEANGFPVPLIMFTLYMNLVALYFLVRGFLENRTIEFRKDEVILSFGWPLCVWKKRITRDNLGVFCTNLRAMMLNSTFAYLSYRNKANERTRFFRLNFFDRESDWAAARIYRWLLRHPPEHSSYVFSESSENASWNYFASLGGHGADELPRRLFCPHCKAKLVQDSWSFSHDTGKCNTCGREFSFREMVYDTHYPESVPKLPGYTWENNDREFCIKRAPIDKFLKFKRFAAMVSMALLAMLSVAIFVLFASVFVYVLRHLIAPKDIDVYYRMKLLTPLVVPSFLLAPVACMMNFAEIHAACRMLWASWSIRCDEKELVITKTYGNTSETRVIPVERIARAERVETPRYMKFRTAYENLFGPFPAESRGEFESIANVLVLTDGTREFLPTFRVPREGLFFNAWLLNSLNRSLHG